MVKRVSIDQWDSEIIQFLKDIQGQPEQYVLELEGQPVAGLVDPARLERMELQNTIQFLRQENAGFSLEEIEKDIEEAVRAARNQP